jgi:hypothetical protein
MELKIAGSGDETLSMLTGEETGSGNGIRQRRMSTSERTDSGFFSSGLCYLLSGLETIFPSNLPVRAQQDPARESG